MIIYLIRHAKSSWNFDLSDMHRPLNPRGRQDVIRMSAFIGRKLPAPDGLISSPASRAFYTGLYFADAWQFPEEDIVLSKDLFHAGIADIHTHVKHFQGQRLALFGHNPGFTNYINQYTGEYLDNLPTCGVAVLNFEDAARTRASLLDLFLPKKIK